MNKFVLVACSIYFTCSAIAVEAKENELLYNDLGLGSNNQIVATFSAHQKVPDETNVSQSEVARKSSRYLLNYSRAETITEQVQLAKEIFAYYRSLGNIQLVSTVKNGRTFYYVVSDNKEVQSRQLFFKDNSEDTLKLFLKEVSSLKKPKASYKEEVKSARKEPPKDEDDNDQTEFEAWWEWEWEWLEEGGWDFYDIMRSDENENEWCGVYEDEQERIQTGHCAIDNG